MCKKTVRGFFYPIMVFNHHQTDADMNSHRPSHRSGPAKGKYHYHTHTLAPLWQLSTVRTSLSSRAQSRAGSLGAPKRLKACEAGLYHSESVYVESV